jgi:aminoglycoside 6'-N-acetyltransferase I
MRDGVRIRAAREVDCDGLAEMYAALWPWASAEEHGKELRLTIKGKARLTMPIAVLLAEEGDGRLAGFVEVDLRSHADGCDPAQPVGYIEGWFVAEEYRRSGIGAKLIAAAEEWARGFGCVEVGSDALIENDVSQSAHESLGYEVVDRCVHYQKRL